MKPKFRAWDKTENLMSDVREISFFDKYVELERGVFRGFDEVALMQSTGMTDKYEDEVYIGDIIWDDMHDEFGVVKLSEAKAIIDWDYIEEDLFENIELLEAIGNIYENKDLLQEER
ncbi:YopX family protein [Staphylococcus pseudintermedius]|uniref:YopX family protein n=1 Tax=Staphylococcus pseudintermedius TaxID=283734 RepID=UPI0039817BE3